MVKKIIDDPIKEKELQRIESEMIGSVEEHQMQGVVFCLNSFLI